MPREGRAHPRGRRAGGPSLRGRRGSEPPGRARCSCRLRAAGLNHLDVWVRKGLPSVPKPRILGADGAGVVAALGEGVEGFAVGDRVVVNPGIPHDGRITVIGEHTDGTYCELKAHPRRRSSIRSTTGCRSRKERRFRSRSRPHTECSSPRPPCAKASGCSSGASAEESRSPRSRSRARTGHAPSSRRRAQRSSRGPARSARTSPSTTRRTMSCRR